MANESNSNVGDREAGNAPVDWFSNVVHIDGDASDTGADRGRRRDPGRTTGDGRSRRRWIPVLVAVAAIAAVGIAILARNGLELGSGSGSETDSRAAGADTGEPSPGSFDDPYPYGLDVTLNYDDLELDRQQEWRVLLLESVLDDAVESDPSTAGRSVMARVRLTYAEGEGPGSTADLRFQVVGRSGIVRPAEDCSAADGRLGDAELNEGQAVEGWLCWTVPDEEVATLVMTVEAEPADGVLYMELQPTSQG